jgi:hypothetical protein
VSARGLAFACLLAGTSAAAQTPPTAPAAKEEEERTTGLPGGVDWTFNLDATWGTFGFANSLYTNPKPEQPSGDLGDNWFEGTARTALTGTYTAPKGWQLYGTASVVGERTYGAAPSLVGEDASSFKPDDLHVGWRSAPSPDDKSLLDLTVGRARYELGHGMLLWDGAAEGGNRGGYWSNARKAFAFAAIGRFKPGPHTVEAFYLDKDDLPEADTGSRLWGANYELSLGEETTLGATYMHWYARRVLSPGRDGLDVYDLRASTAPFPGLRALSFEAEYAREDNGLARDSQAWSALAAYQFARAWKPKLSYRYAFFQGDDPDTPAQEAFDGLFTGFSDWGSWWQGEIAGEYFVANSNLVSHQVRLHLEPSERVGAGLIGYRFLADQPATLAPGVSARDIAVELDLYLDWKLNHNFTVSVVAALADPGRAVEQATGRTDSFSYGMFYVAYSY